MQIAGLNQSAKVSAGELYALWRHLPEAECIDQIEAHMESEGFDEDEIAEEIDALGLFVLPEYELRVCAPA